MKHVTCFFFYLLSVLLTMLIFWYIFLEMYVDKWFKKEYMQVIWF